MNTSDSQLSAAGCLPVRVIQLDSGNCTQRSTSWVVQRPKGNLRFLPGFPLCLLDKLLLLFQPPAQELPLLARLLTPFQAHISLDLPAFFSDSIYHRNLRMQPRLISWLYYLAVDDLR